MQNSEDTTTTPIINPEEVEKIETVQGEQQQPAKKKKKKHKKKNKATQGEQGEKKLQDAEDQAKKQHTNQQEQQSKAQKPAAADEQQEQVKQPAKKKKKPKKKKQKYSKLLDNSQFRVLCDWKQAPYKQTPTASKTIAEQFPDGNYPTGQILEHPSKAQYDNSYRISSAEMRQKDRIHQLDIQKLRKAAECHRQVRRQAQMEFIKPGRKMIDIVEDIENLNRKLIQANMTEAGMAFPCGASMNHCAAHWTPNPNDSTVLTDKDVVKFDFGTQVNGLIIDCAFTVAFDPVFDNLLNAAKDATNTGIRQMGIDARLGEIGEAIQEAMESYEVELNGKTLPVKCVRNLNGHSIAPYRIHAGKSVPIVKGGPLTKMEEGQLFAIQTFGSTGKGFVMQDTDCSHYMKNFDATKAPIRMPKAGALYSHIQKNFKTLAFARRWLQNGGFPKHVVALRHLVDCGLIDAYPPLVDNIGSHVAQFEHTIYLRPTCKEVLSRGDDY